MKYEVQTRDKGGDWMPSDVWKPKTRGDAMNGVDVLYRLQFHSVRALENGRPFYSRERTNG